uniref:phage tail tape measure protein n=1 Tax=Enterocloster clostridioformis TaxID=1531 RepID=UPI0026773094|nr:phage tail tape measure protein [Enterocloster clostridioformis]
MAETVRIEIPIETIDNTDPELSNVTRNFERMEKAAESANGAAKKANSTVTQFDRQAQKTEKSLASWAKEKYEIMLEAKDRITPVLSTLGNGIRSFAGKTWSVTMRAVDLITSPVRGIINLLKNPVFQVGAVLGVSIGLKDTIETYKDFEAAMSQVQAISGATGSEVTKLTNKAKEMGATTKFTAEESAEAFNYMAMAGWKTEDMLSGIEGILSLAAASGEDLATTSDIVTDALTAFNMKASDAGRFSDVLAAAASNANTTVSGMGETFKYAGSMAGALGYSIEDVALMTGLMANTGIKATMAGTALNSIFTRLSTNTNGAADAMSDLGIEFFTSEGNARDLSDVMEELRSATVNMTAEQKSQLANTIAGTQAQKGLLAILNASEEDYNKLANAINNADGAAANMSETMLDNLQGSITLLQSAVDGVKISFGERLSPYVRGLADWLTAQMPAVEQGLDEFMDWLDTKIDRMQRKFNAIADTKEWQDADFFGKVKIAWDEFIAEPFSEWWNSTGKAKFADFAQDIGAGIGTGLKVGVMAMLGIDIGETLDEGVSIGASFAKGFSEGFDFQAISEKLWQGFSNLLSNAGKLLPGGEAPDLSSIFSAVMLSKIATPFISMGRGAASIGKGLFGTNAATGTSLMGSFLGSAAAGTGLLGKSGLLAINLGAGNLAGGASMSAAALSATGMAAGGGAIAAGATLVSSALDAYKAIKSDNREESKAYGESAAWKAGGVAAGAAAGAAIGSIIPGIGTAVGALVGAGVGGIAGWIKGNKVKEEYQENVEEMRKEAEKAQKVFEATGLSIEDVIFKNEALAQAMNDSEVSAEQFALMFQEECANVAKKAFGDISLSLAEVKKVASEITFADMAEELSEFAQATADTETALNNLQSSVTGLKKENWKVGLGMELSETDKDSYKSAIENFLSTSQAFIDDNHYQATVALKLLTGGEADTTGLDSYYGGLKSRIEDLGTQLTDSMNIALEDSVITLDEAAELESLQEQISAITNKLTEAKTDAEMQALKIKYNGAALDMDSFNALQEELQANVASASEQYESALTLTLTNLNLQLADGAITQSEYDEAVAEATEGYYTQINELSARVSTFNLDSIATAWDSELSRIMPEVEGSTTEKLTQALNNALLAHPDVKAWTTADVISWMGLDKLNLDTVEQTTIAAELIQTALAVPEGTKETIIQDFKSQIPTAEEIEAAIDWDSMTGNDWTALMESITGPPEGPTIGLSAEDAAKPMAEYYGEYFESIKQSYSEALHNALESSNDQETLNSFLEQYMTQQTGDFDFSSVMAQYGPISNEYYEQLVSEWMAAGTAYGDALNNGASTSLLAGSPLLRTDLQTALNTATASPFTISPTVNVMPNYNITAPTFPAFNQTQNASGHAAGGYVSGGPQLSWLAEEGYGEFVIPTNPSRRARALDLYEQAGVALGVSANAAGGYVGGSILSDTASDYNLFGDINRNAPIAYNETTEGKYDGETAWMYEPVPAERESSLGSSPVQVSVSMAPEFVIHGGDGQSEEDIMQVIRKHLKEMADELGGEIAGKLEEVFSNMPLKEA